MCSGPQCMCIVVPLLGPTPTMLAQQVDAEHQPMLKRSQVICRADNRPLPFRTGKLFLRHL